MSRYRMKVAKQGALTNWKWHREGLVRTWKEPYQDWVTHSLETVEGGTCQDTKESDEARGGPPTGDGRRRGVSGHEMKTTEHGELTFWRRQRERPVRTQKKATEQGALTS